MAKLSGGEPRRQPVDPGEGAPGEFAEAVGRQRARGRPVPVPRQVLGQAEQDRPKRPRQEDEPEEDAEDVPVCQLQAVLAGLPDDLVGVDLGRLRHIVGAGLPLRQFAACRRQVAVGQRDLDLGEPVAELAEAHREVQHGHVDQQRQPPGDAQRERVGRADYDQ